MLHKQPPSGRVWKPRQRGAPAIGRIYYSNPTAGERYYLRLLLTVVKGSTSYEDVRTIDRREYPTFKDACVVIGLLQNDNHWIESFEEAFTYQSGKVLRIALAGALVSGEMQDPRAIWTKYAEQFCDDCEH